MVSKDQTIGGVICIVCALLAIFYIVTLIAPNWLSTLGSQAADETVRFWLIAIPVVIAFIAILGIGAWIGWTMATTPPPKPIEELTTTVEEKKEEAVIETREEIKEPEAKEPEPPAEEKKPERKRKTEKSPP